VRLLVAVAWVVAIGLAAREDGACAADVPPPAKKPDATPQRPLSTPPPGRFSLFPLPAAPFVAVPLAMETAGPTRWDAEVAEERLFHRPGDPDSLFSLGGSGPSGEARVAAAFEVNEVLLRAIAPDPRVAASDPRGRLTGDYRALDSAGRPYQFRLGARLVW